MRQASGNILMPRAENLCEEACYCPMRCKRLSRCRDALRLSLSQLCISILTAKSKPPVRALAMVLILFRDVNGRENDINVMTCQ